MISLMHIFSSFPKKKKYILSVNYHFSDFEILVFSISPVRISQASTIIELHALVPLFIKVPAGNGCFTRAPDLRQVTTATADWLNAHLLASVLIGEPVAGLALLSILALAIPRGKTSGPLAP